MTNDDLTLWIIRSSSWQGQLVLGNCHSSDMWKETGWNSIIYLAAMAGIDQSCTKLPVWTARTAGDGCGTLRCRAYAHDFGTVHHVHRQPDQHRFREAVLAWQPLVTDYSEVLDIYAFKYGIQMSRFSYGTAIGIFNSVVSIILLFTANGLFKKFTKESIM